jgi:hypothetical protein
MMWRARQSDDDLNTIHGQELLRYCQWGREAFDRLYSPYGACLTWLASGESSGDEVRGKLCGEALRKGPPDAIPISAEPTPGRGQIALAPELGRRGAKPSPLHCADTVLVRISQSV